MRAAILIVLLATTTLITGVAQPTDNLTLFRSYLKAFEAIDFDKMGTFLHDSVAFFDISSSANGKQAVINTWKNTFNPVPKEIKFEIGEYFVSGSFVVMNLRYEAVMKIQERNTIVNIEVITVAQFKSGKIILLHDYPDIDTFNRQLINQIGGQLTSGSGESNLKVVTDFFRAYSDWNIPLMTSFYSDNIEFKDLTAKEAFKGGRYEHSGKASTTAFWSGIFGDTKPPFLKVNLESAFASGDFVVANTRFSLELPISWTGGKKGLFVNVPIKTLLEVKEGKIVRHYDFVDYKLYNQQINIQK
jgi:limonene-1,2-epoxide hydrolase/ketosteroid isomerase-like protein